MNISCLKFAIAAAIGLLLASCASVSVKPLTDRPTPKMPQKIYVIGFATNHCDYRVDREGEELRLFKENLRTILQAAMVADISRRLLPVVLTAKEDQGFPPQNAWVIRGEFRRVNQGSRFLRGAIGFGAGGTKLETSVRVYDLARHVSYPFLAFDTIGGSGAEPGAITAIATDPLEIAVEAVLGGGSGVAHGLTEDAKRTAREITAELSEYMYHSGWISKNNWIRPKILNKWEDDD